MEGFQRLSQEGEVMEGFQRLSQEGEAWEVFNVSGAVLNVNHESHTPVTTNLTLLVLIPSKKR
jgi:hypothetical protein